MRGTAATVALLAAALLLRPASASVGEAPAGGVLALYDRSGNTITVSNRFNGASSFVQVSSWNRYNQVNWDRSHADGYDERVTAARADADGNVYLVGVRSAPNGRFLWVIKYAPRGDVLWERVDNLAGCVGFDVAVDATGHAWAAGSCLQYGHSPVRLVRFDAWGSPMWAQSFDEGGRNYVRSISVDYGERGAVVVEVSSQSSSYPRTVVFGPQGGRLAAY